MSSRFLGKCRSCKTVLRVEGVVRSTLRNKAVYLFPNGDTSTVAHHDGRHFVPCWNCFSTNGLKRDGRMQSLELHRVVGVVTDEPCNAKCTGATGHQCECSCGGANHGRHA